MDHSFTSDYQPPQKVLFNYANVLVNLALNSGRGVQPGEVVELVVPDVAKALAKELRNAVLRAGGHPILRLYPTEMDREFYELANDEQLKFFPKKYTKARTELIDHSLSIIADPDPNELKTVDPKKIILARDSKKKYREWLTAKENQGKFTWTIGLWAVPAKAELVGLSLKEYWQQIIQACFLDKPDPLAEWRKVWHLQESFKKELNQLPIKTLHIQGADVDLQLELGQQRQWLGGGGRNIPSFEIFTSPDWRGSNGWIRFNQPLYRYGQVIQDIYLRFSQGSVVEATARQGQAFLQEMIKSPNANKIGEFSLTDKRFSRITHPMAETLFDENIGGEQGNTHIALGMAYQDCLVGNAAKLTKKDWAKLGFNDSAEHTDIVSTTKRWVTATLTNGQKKVIYDHGQFVL